MKLFLAFVVIAVASATPYRLSGEQAEIQQIIEAINSPYTDPATSVALQNILHDLLDIHHEPEPISIGPALVEEFEPIHVGPTIVDDDVIIAPATPAVSQTGSSPLVQIIVNVANKEQQIQTPDVVGSPALTPETVNVVDNAPETINVVEQAPESVNVVDLVPETVDVVDQVPEAVNIVQPIIPIPVVNLPADIV